MMFPVINFLKLRDQTTTYGGLLTLPSTPSTLGNFWYFKVWRIDELLLFNQHIENIQHHFCLKFFLKTYNTKLQQHVFITLFSLDPSWRWQLAQLSRNKPKLNILLYDILKRVRSWLTKERNILCLLIGLYFYQRFIILKKKSGGERSGPGTLFLLKLSRVCFY